MRMHIPHTEIHRCPWGGRCTQDAGHHKCHQSSKLWAKTSFQVSQKAAKEQTVLAPVVKYVNV